VRFGMPDCGGEAQGVSSGISRKGANDGFGELGTCSPALDTARRAEQKAYGYVKEART
jgi:hypothetical protein